ncbi:alpha/beta hydrolase [Kribbella antibiotica]|uniref:Alpha/beta hydrolase n=1 Tax=Kribbella antibiotica TaxID=190195 RepID=A0A4R4YPB5_9ACTN|nr:alpha/beta hydrolase [Kribbella antibiotica]TDD46988.1 alpha/beta hydrolase [Kribbella antibiotica]
MRLRSLAWGVVLTVTASSLAVLPASAAVQWTDCKLEGNEKPEVIKGSECATLQLPVDWRSPNGPTFGLEIARRTGKHSTGVLIFGPGGPGDSGVDRIKTGIARFSPELQDRFDIVSFDPRGIARSNPVKCTTSLYAAMPSPLVRNQAEFGALADYNRRLADDCRRHTGPLYDHVDTWQTVRDVDAIRRALGAAQITFHGGSYGTPLGAQYAETYPHRVRAMVLESVLDHSLATPRQFLDPQAASIQDSFDEFVNWCDRTTTCALHGQDVRARWADVLARSGNKFNASFVVFRMLYGPQWNALATTLQRGVIPTPPPPTGELVSYTFAPFCQDWSLRIGTYREYDALLKHLARANPDMPYPGQLMAISACLGLPKANNPQHRLDVKHLRTPILLANARHDPATAYAMAQNVQRQLGRDGVLLTYEGWGHGSYSKSECMQQTIDRYLIDRKVPKRGTTCAAVPPTG